MIRFLCLALCGLLSFAFAGEPKPNVPVTPGPISVPVPPTQPPAQPAQPAPPPLYLRAGGIPGIAVLADDFATRFLADETLLANPKLKELLGKVSKSAFRFYTTVIFCQISGGPERYSGPSLFEYYRDMKVADKEWDAVGALLQKSLEETKVPAEQQKEWKEQLAQLRKALDFSLANEPVPYQSKDKGFSISFPKAWERQENVGGVAVLSQSQPSNEKDAFREQAAVSVEELPLEMTAEEFAKASALSGRQLKEFKVIEMGPVNLNKLAGHRLVYTHKVGTHDLHVISLMFLQGKRAYTINCVAAVDQLEVFRGLFETILRSFKLADEEAPKAPEKK